MHGRIATLLAVLTTAATAAPAAAHDVSMKAIFGSIPAASWDAQSATWTISLAAMIDCVNADRVDGALIAEPVVSGGPLAPLVVGGSPGQVVREQFENLPAGDYKLVFGAAGCGGTPQSDDDQGTHGASYENIELQRFTLPDCSKPGAVYARRSFTPRPLIPLTNAMPPNADIACTPPAPPPCPSKARAFRLPVLPVKGTGVTVQPCAAPGSDAPAANVGCKPATARATIAAAKNPLLPGPPGKSPPKSTKKNCFGAIEVQAAPVKPRTCTRPLLPVPCTPKPTPPAMGYTASFERLARIRFKLAAGHHEFFILKLSDEALAKASKEGTALRFVVTVRDAAGRTHRTTSRQFTLESTSG